MLRVTHDGTKPGDVQERCCMCRTPTRYWHSSDVALCQVCAKKTKRAELPAKKDWCAKEDAIFRAAHPNHPHALRLGAKETT